MNVHGKSSSKIDGKTYRKPRENVTTLEIEQYAGLSSIKFYARAVLLPCRALGDDCSFYMNSYVAVLSIDTTNGKTFERTSSCNSSFHHSPTITETKPTHIHVN